MIWVVLVAFVVGLLLGVALGTLYAVWRDERKWRAFERMVHQSRARRIGRS